MKYFLFSYQKIQRGPRVQVNLLDDAISQTGNDDQHPGQSPLDGREHLSKDHRPLNCRRAVYSQKSPHKIKKNTTCGLTYQVCRRI